MGVEVCVPPTTNVAAKSGRADSSAQAAILPEGPGRPPQPGQSRVIAKRRKQQIYWSLAHYFSEFVRIRSPREFAEWIYYKYPSAFPLRDFPSKLTLEITNECNFGCPHCPRNELNAERGLGFMDMAVFRKIAAEGAGRVTTAKFIGLGEPSLHPHLPEMLGLLLQNGIKSIVYTNGTLLERFEPEDIASWGLEVIVLSIDGLDERSFNRLRVGGDYQSIRNRLAAFRRWRDDHGAKTPHVEIRHVIMPNETPAGLNAFRDDWLEGGGDSVKFNVLGPHYDERRKEDPNRPPCRDIRREIHVRYDGRVPMCGYDGQRQWLGDLRQATLQQVWRSVTLEEVRAKHARRDLSSLPFCRTCQFR